MRSFAINLLVHISQKQKIVPEFEIQVKIASLNCFEPQSGNAKRALVKLTPADCLIMVKQLNNHVMTSAQTPKTFVLLKFCQTQSNRMTFTIAM